MKNLPSVLVACTQNLDSENLIKLIIKDENISKNEPEHGITVYNWRIDNKYYSAEINLCSIGTKDSLPTEFIKSVHAFIIYFNSDSSYKTQELNEWAKFIEKWNISEKILVCDSISRVPEAEKDQINDWCIQNKYELVELESTIEPEDSSFFNENVGIDRVTEILQTYEWPNLVMKEKTSGIIRSLNTEDELKSEQSSDSLSKISNENSTPACSENNANEEAELENIEKLTLMFKNLQSVKKEISSLTVEQKLEQAEKVVKTFWTAMGGDNDEFSDSDNENPT